MTRRRLRRAADCLTEREVEILEAYARCGAKGAAAELQLSETRIRHALANARSKLGAPTNTELAVHAAERVRARRRWAPIGP